MEELSTAFPSGMSRQHDTSLTNSSRVKTLFPNRRQKALYNFKLNPESLIIDRALSSGNTDGVILETMFIVLVIDSSGVK